MTTAKKTAKKTAAKKSPKLSVKDLKDLKAGMRAADGTFFCCNSASISASTASVTSAKKSGPSRG